MTLSARLHLRDVRVPKRGHSARRIWNARCFTVPNRRLGRMGNTIEHHSLVRVECVSLDGSCDSDVRCKRIRTHNSAGQCPST